MRKFKLISEIITQRLIQAFVLHVIKFPINTETYT